MTKKLKTVPQVMELSIHHHVPPEAGSPGTTEAERLEAHLKTLPPAFAAALRAELAEGTLVATLVHGSGLRVSAARPRGRRAKPAGS